MFGGKAVHGRQGLPTHIAGLDLPAGIHEKILLTVHVVFKIDMVLLLLGLGQDV